MSSGEYLTVGAIVGLLALFNFVAWKWWMPRD